MIELSAENLQLPLICHCGGGGGERRTIMLRPFSFSQPLPLATPLEPTKQKGFVRQLGILFKTMVTTKGLQIFCHFIKSCTG